MWSKNKQKTVRSLAQKKYRIEEQAFLAEGPKVVGDLLGHFPCRLLAGTEEYLHRLPVDKIPAREIVNISPDALKQASLLQAPRDVLAVFDLPQIATCPAPSAERLVLALDDIQDPGNLGTIIRLADWFGITDIVCSTATVDAFSPKVVQATMGALARVRVHYTDMSHYIESGIAAGVPVYGTFLDGTNLYDCGLTAGGIIVMGNEGNGISTEVESRVTHRLYIPNFPLGQPTSESLNVAIATGIICAEFRRRAAYSQS